MLFIKPYILVKFRVLVANFGWSADMLCKSSESSQYLNFLPYESPSDRESYRRTGFVEFRYLFVKKFVKR